jgi:VCBS repeat protein
VRTHSLGSVATDADSVVAADFNGDGIMDLALADAHGGAVSILLGLGSGDFGLPVSFGVGIEPSALAVADFNGDGKPDLAVANGGSGNVSVMTNTSP